MKVSTTTYGLLGLLAVRSWTGYELTQQMRRSLRFVWSSSEGHLYREQTGLVELGWAAVEDEQAQEPSALDALLLLALPLVAAASACASVGGGVDAGMDTAGDWVLTVGGAAPSQGRRGRGAREWDAERGAEEREGGKEER